MPDPASLLHLPALSDAAKSAYAATVDAPARSVFTAGACPLDAEGRTVAPSTPLGVTVRGYPDQLVEVAAVAAVRMRA
ncbi:hypothetical protein AB0B94_16975 [Micromonospora sp. NPDC048986]|uniref:hypothetical protein n=1 Tax=Micromonospora sp. NPDC048986 TaxID=3155644 RepID=UPI0033E9C740